MFEAKIIVADFKTSLAAKMAAGATTGSIVNNLDDDGVTLPTGKYYFTLDADSTVKEHLTCTLTGKNMTDIKSVSRQGVETVGTVREHRIGATVSITDFAHIKMINDFASQYSGKWMGAVANFAALSALVGSEDGEVRVTLDDDKLYIYDLTTATWILAGAGGGAGTVYRTTLLGTESTGDDNKTFTMTSGSFPDKKYLQVYKNGVLMGEGATNDYVATGSNQAVFNNVVLDDDVITLLVVSVDLYNPAWRSVNDDILPDTDNAYDIGSTTKKFKTLYVDTIVSGSILDTFGDGSDGDVVISTNTDLTRDMFYNNLTINNGITLSPKGYRIYVLGTLTFVGTGKILQNAGNGGNGANVSQGINLSGENEHLGGTVGTSTYYLASLPSFVRTKGAGANGVYSNSTGSSNGGNALAENIGKALYTASTGGNGGSISNPASKTGGQSESIATLRTVRKLADYEYLLFSKLFIDSSNNTIDIVYDSNNNTGGSSGASGVQLNSNVSSGGGGGAGAHSGFIVIYAKNIVNLAIEAKGGNGGNAGVGGGWKDTYAAGGSGGGAGGNGATVFIIYNNLLTLGTIDVSKGIGGLKSSAKLSGSGAGTDGANGADGLDGKIIYIKTI